MTFSRTARRAVVAGFATLTLGLAACGGDDTDGGDDTTATDDTASQDPTTDSTATENTATDDTTTDETTSGGDVDLDAYVAEAAAQLEFDDDGLADCVARGIVEPLGADAIAATGLSPEDFMGADSLTDTGIEITDEDRAEMEGQIADCGGIVEELITQQFADDPEVAACVAAELDEAIVANVLVATITGSQPSQAALDAQAKTQACDPEA